MLTEEEVRRLLAETSGTSGLVLRLLYGTGMRVMEALRLRAKDLNFGRREIVVREGKGFRDRVTIARAARAIRTSSTEPVAATAASTTLWTSAPSSSSLALWATCCGRRRVFPG